MNKAVLYLADIRQLAEREAEGLALLTPERRTRAERYRPRQDRLHCIAGGLLLRRVLGVTSDADLRVNEYGKPELVSQSTCFSLSHGGDFAALAVFHSPVGVDIEPVGEKLPISIPKRYLQPDELAWLESEPTPERFSVLWTRLESALKADGRGFGLERRDFSVLDSGQPWYIETSELEGHCLSCAGAEPFEVELHLLTAEELLK